MLAAVDYPIAVQGDFLAKQTRAHPVHAVAELIWNSLDADANIVKVLVEQNDLGGIVSITVEDNGDGLRHDEAPKLFSSLGGSWKLEAGITSKNHRFLHGSEGKGRFKAFALGTTVKWEVVYKEKDQFISFSISMKAGQTTVHISAPVPAKTQKTGVKCRISALSHSPNSLIDSSSIQTLSEIFATYLRTYPGIQIILPAGRLNPDIAIETTKLVKIDDIENEKVNYAATVEIIEWKSPTDRVLYLCNEQGFPLSRGEMRIHVPGLNFSAYLKSNLVTKLSHDGTLEISDQIPGVQQAIEQAKDSIREFYRERCAKRAKSTVDKWKEESVYPYRQQPNTDVERVEQEVFDIVAVQVSELLPDFATAQSINKKFQLHMLKQAIERSPEELELILSEVLNLNEKKRKELADLLKETSLSAIISASKLVTDRLKIVAGLEKLLFDPDEKRLLKERTQLHRILAANSWIFGEEFNILIDDQSLTEALRQHLKSLNEDMAVSSPVLVEDGSRGILDLMLARRVPAARDEDLDYLVVELKRPTVKIGSDEIAQVKKYAAAVAGDSRFYALNTRWTFWVISNDMDNIAKMDSNQKGAPRGRISETTDPNMTIWIKTWSEVLQENKHRLSLFQKHLDFRVNHDDAVDFLRARHKELWTAAEAVPVNVLAQVGEPS